MATGRYKNKDGDRRAAIAALYAGAGAIVAVGLAFGAYSWINHVSYSVMGMEIPGLVFAAVAVFLGARYFRSVQKMSKALNASAQRFSWSNFKLNKTKKRRVEG